MPGPYVQHLLEANALAREAMKTPEVGILIQPIPVDRLRVGTITDACWGNVKENQSAEMDRDHWIEEKDRWIRKHVQPRQILFHPGSVSGGPDPYEIQNDRRMIRDGHPRQLDDLWNHRDSQQSIRSGIWTGQSTMSTRKLSRRGEEGDDQRELPPESKTCESRRLHHLFLRRENGGGGSGVPYIRYCLEELQGQRCTVNALSAAC